ncbi:WcaI family glycosyltransferase [Chitinophaga horti]|uniref:WcaI family glycosyltransferase n=1 Tax=Chitinophaga horti TaxID=2920382 RepID=A0ABY6IYI9_9BACT|nr:WcaI family glycosyltransferase [Chitinophaga horti]UYQ92350.1 WcaI family glycosyltransferase [Chitinophaga horti]
MKKRLLLIGGNFSPEPTGIGKYNGEMMTWLARSGYDCTVITSYPYYPQWKVQEPYDRGKSWYKKELVNVDDSGNGGRLKVYRCPQYVPGQPSGKKRMMLDFSFAVSAFFKLMQLLPGKKYDVVISVVPAFHLGLLGVLYKKLRRARFHYHIQDLQIEAARDLNMIKSKKMINTLLGVEKYILKQADYVSSISDGMISRIAEKVNKDVVYFPNWADIDLFHPIEERGELKRAYGFQPEDKVVLYSGAMGEKQGLESILETAAVLKEVKFVLCGSGPYKEKLQQMVQQRGLTNVLFFPLQPFETFNQFLNMADLHLVIQKANASDLVMPSKLTTILAVGGLSLITANEGSGLHTLVKKYDMGLLVDAENPQALTEGVRRALRESHEQIRQNARAYAEEHLSIRRVMARYEETVVNCQQ